jgi:predicted nucleotidyltransferase component of viral defense system
MIPNRDEDRRNRKRRWMRYIEMSWGEILTVCEEEFGEENLVMVERVERTVPNWSHSPFSIWVVIVLNDFPHPILFEVNHPRFKMSDEGTD